MALLRDALLPNLVQSTDGTPALVHGGPFANIAHGCNSVIATRAATRLADWVVTEAGFGCDLGAEKFFHVKCASAGLNPSAVVMVATVRALKMHGGVALSDLTDPNPEAVERGLPNLEKHIDTIAAFEKPVVVALNRRDTDTDTEIEVVAKRCEEMGVAFACSDHFARGGEGARALARTLVEITPDQPSPLKTLYSADDTPEDKIKAVAARVYGAQGVNFTKDAKQGLRAARKLGYANLPICMAKTQSSLSDNPSLLGRPPGFDLTVRDVLVNGGAGFIVALTGEMLRMPGLPRVPAAEGVDLVDGEIVGVG